MNTLVYLLCYATVLFPREKSSYLLNFIQGQSENAKVTEVAAYHNLDTRHLGPLQRHSLMSPLREPSGNYTITSNQLQQSYQSNCNLVRSKYISIGLQQRIPVSLAETEAVRRSGLYSADIFNSEHCD